MTFEYDLEEPHQKLKYTRSQKHTNYSMESDKKDINDVLV